MKNLYKKNSNKVKEKDKNFNIFDLNFLFENLKNFKKFLSLNNNNNSNDDFFQTKNNNNKKNNKETLEIKNEKIEENKEKKFDYEELAKKLSTKIEENLKIFDQLEEEILNKNKIIDRQNTVISNQKEIINKLLLNIQNYPNEKKEENLNENNNEEINNNEKINNNEVIKNNFNKENKISFSQNQKKNKNQNQNQNSKSYNIEEININTDTQNENFKNGNTLSFLFSKSIIDCSNLITSNNLEFNGKDSNIKSNRLIFNRSKSKSREKEKENLEDINFPLNKNVKIYKGEGENKPDKKNKNIEILNEKEKEKNKFNTINDIGISNDNFNILNKEKLNLKHDSESGYFSRKKYQKNLELNNIDNHNDYQFNQNLQNLKLETFEEKNKNMNDSNTIDVISNRLWDIDIKDSDIHLNK